MAIGGTSSVSDDERRETKCTSLGGRPFGNARVCVRARELNYGLVFPLFIRMHSTSLSNQIINKQIQISSSLSLQLANFPADC